MGGNVEAMMGWVGKAIGVVVAVALLAAAAMISVGLLVRAWKFMVTS